MIDHTTLSVKCLIVAWVCANPGAYGQEPVTLKGHPLTVLSVAFSRDGTRLVLVQRELEFWLV